MKSPGARGRNLVLASLAVLTVLGSSPAPAGEGIGAARIANLGLLLAQPLPNCPTAPPSLAGAWPTAQQLSDFNQWMACLGPRLTGTPEHEKLLQQIESAMGAVPGLAASPVPTHFIDWRQVSPWPTLQLGPGPPLQAAGYMPHSGLGTVTGELVFEKPGFWKRHIPLLNLIKRFKFKRSKHEGKIVAVSIPNVAFPKWGLKYLSRCSRSDFANWAPYERTIWLEKTAPCLAEAREAGVKGVIGVLEMSPEHAERQYAPWAREPDRPIGEGVPAIYVNSEQGALVEAHAQTANPVATLSLDGSVDCCATSRHLVYTLPGASFGGPSDEIVLVQTHTDGPSALEENGPIALIALAHHLAQIPQPNRRRTVVFLFATGHMVKQLEGAKDLLWRDPPSWLERTRVAVAIEHLGATEWIDSAAGYSGRVDPSSGGPLAEPPLLFVTTGDGERLEALVHGHLSEHRRILMPARKRMKTFLRRDFFGEGQYVSCAGIPTVGYVPNPSYLFSFADPGGLSQRGHFEKLDADRMLAELTELRDLVDVLVKDPLAGWPSVTPDVSKCEAAPDPCE